MYKPTEPTRCPKCGAIVKVDVSKILTSNPPCYEWTCPNCGEKGNTKHGDIITFENQVGRTISEYNPKAGEPDISVGVATTNGDDNTRIDVIPAWSACSINTECTICGEEFEFDGKHRICPKCREAVVKLRETAAGTTANAMPAGKSTTVTDPKTTACDIPGKPFLQQGWECPKCGAILAPHQHYCPFCSPSQHGTQAHGTTLYAEWTNKDNLTPPSGQYTNPNLNTSVSVGGKFKVVDSCTATFETPHGDIKVSL